MVLLTLIFSTLILSSCSRPDYSGNEVIIYSQSGCNYCQEKRELLTQKGVPFEEFYIDSSSVARFDMYKKLKASGYLEKSVGTPVIEVNGHIMPGNPSFDEIREHLVVTD